MGKVSIKMSPQFLELEGNPDWIDAKLVEYLPPRSKGKKFQCKICGKWRKRLAYHMELAHV